MKLKPMLGEFALDDIETIESSESRALVEHSVPGLEGSYFQDLGSVPNTIVITGTKHGDERRAAFLEGIRELFSSGQPTTFVADINTATDLTEVVIEDLEVAEVAGSADTFRYRVKLRKYVEPPEPPAAGLLDGGILDDALSLTDALDVIDALGSIPDLGDPTEPLRGALDGVKGATSGLDQTVGSLRSLFGEPGAGPGGVPGAGPAADGTTAGPPGAAPSAGETLPGEADPAAGGTDPTCVLVAEPETVALGEHSTLLWSSEHGVSATLNGAPVEADGIRNFSPLATTTFTLVVHGAPGTDPATCTQTVTLSPPPPCSATEACIVRRGSGRITDLESGEPILLDGSDMVHVLILPEGYMAEDLGTFDDDVEAWLAEWEVIEPYKTFQDAFCIWKMPAESKANVENKSPQKADTAFLVPIDKDGNSVHSDIDRDGPTAERVWNVVETSFPFQPKSFYPPGGRTSRIAKNLVVVVLVLDPSLGESGFAGRSRRLENPKDSDQRLSTAFAHNRPHEFSHAFSRLEDEYLDDHKHIDAKGKSRICSEVSPPLESREVTNVVCSPRCDELPWAHLLAGTTINPSTAELVGAFGVAKIGYHPELKCLMNGRHDNKKYYGGDGKLRTRKRFCNFCMEVTAFRLFERIHVLDDPSTSYQEWAQHYRKPFFDLLKFQVPDPVPQENSEGKPIFEACKEAPASTAKAFVVHFGVDKAFVEPCMRAVLGRVADYAATHPDEKLLIVGHTDFTGSSAYNDSLAERRARSVYSFLTYGRDADAARRDWDALRQPQLSNALPTIKDTWGTREYKYMLQDLDFYSGNIDDRHDPKTAQAVREFQEFHDLPATGVVDTETWRALIDDYLAQDELAIPEGQFFANARDGCEGGIVKWLGCGQHDPVARTHAAWRPNRRTECLFVRASAIPCEVPEPVTFDLPAPGFVGERWCLGPGDPGDRCCFLSRESEEPEKWLVEPADRRTVLVKGRIRFEDGSPAANAKYALIAPDGEYLHTDADGKPDLGESQQHPRRGQPIPSRADERGRFSHPQPTPAGTYVLELLGLRDPQVAKRSHEPDHTARGNVVCRQISPGAEVIRTFEEGQSEQPELPKLPSDFDTTVLQTPPPTKPVKLKVQNRLFDPRTREAIPRVDVTVASSTFSVSGRTNDKGRTDIDLPSGDSEADLTVKPADSDRELALSLPVGPGVAPNGALDPDRIWRRLETRVRVKGRRIKKISSTDKNVTVKGRTVTVNLQPAWMQSPNFSSRSAAPSLIVLHGTGTKGIKSAINTFMTKKSAAHYVIDLDGQIVKMVREEDRARHAGSKPLNSHWKGQDDVDEFSIGIEIVHENQKNKPYTKDQYDSLLKLLKAITAHFSTTSKSNIAGHSDIAIEIPPKTPARILGRKGGDPGKVFDWSKLEAAGFGPGSVHTPDVKTMYAGIFKKVANIRLRHDPQGVQHDNDSEPRYGSVKRKDMSGKNIIKELKADLRAIGYFCPDTGTFDKVTAWTVMMFQDHFFNAGSPHPNPAKFKRGEVDIVTAQRIKEVRP